MQIRKILLLVEILFGCIFISCNNDLDNNKNQEKSKSTGIISGKVLYSNLNESQNAGIIITLDKTDGLRTATVIKAVVSRNIMTKARSIVANTVTNADGSYTFENIESGTYTIYAASPYSTEKAVYTNVVVREAEMTIADVLTLTATGRITGKITLDEGDSGNTGFLVFIAGTSYMAITDDAGNYTISDVPAGNGYQLVVMKNNVIHFLETDVVVNANSLTTIVTNNFTSKELKAADGKDGADGTSIVWLGSFEDESEIENPQYLNAYFNMKNGCSYIYDGTKWTLLSAKGDKGDSGADGKDGENGSNGTDGKDALAIGTVLSTEELTNQNVIITVNITQADISKIGYVYFSDNQNWNTANSILTNSAFISIQPDSNGKYQVVADKNGYYAFAVKNSDGYSAFTEEYITNIDKTAPGPVSNLIAKYNKNTKVLSVTWTNPTDSDFDYAVLGYTKGGVTVTSNVRITNGTYTLSDVESDGEEFVFTVYARDKTGNTSNSQTVNVTPVEGPKVQSITLSRYHWAYNDPDQTVTATAIISNADLIEDGTVVKFQTKDPNGNITNTVATVDKKQGKATAILTAPINTSGSDSVTYTVLCKIGDEAANADYTARFNISSCASLNPVYGIQQSLNGLSDDSGIMQIPLSSVTNSTTEIVQIQGLNFDLTQPSIQLYDSTGTAYFDEPIPVDISSVVWTETIGTNEQIINTVIKVPAKDDVYTVRILFDGIVQMENWGRLQVYDVPKFTSFTIPIVSITKEDNMVTAKISGKNFDAPDVDLTKITAICTTKPSIVANSSFIKNSDSSINAKFNIPGIIGEYDITIVYGTQSITSTLKVQDFNTYSVGDVLLSDGTIVTYDADNLNFTNEQKQKAIGIIYGFNEYDAPIGYLGIYNSSNNSNFFNWSILEKSQIMFNEIICNPSVIDIEAANSAIFTGDKNGQDNWEYICSIDPVGSANMAENYPVFNYLNNYSTTFSIPKKYAENWYIPSIAELCCICKNRTILNSVLIALEGVTISESMYWSSSQCSEDNIYVWYIGMSTASILYNYKYGAGLVCCVRPFE